jgi:DNA adenine methylase
MTKPFLKWVGGKTQILDKIMGGFPTKMENYIEPFLGGGSVLFRLLENMRDGKTSVVNKIFASDTNEALIHTYINIKNNPEKFIRKMRRLKEKMMKLNLDDRVDFYYKQREVYNSLNDKTSFKCSVLFVFLNKTCFRGMYRTGPNGFNVPYGNYVSPDIIDEDNIMNVSALIKDVVFTCCSYEEALKNPLTSFVYLDPPYYPINEKSFVSYNRAGFNQQEHEKLFTLLQKLNQNWLLSNSKTKFVCESFIGYPISTINCKRRINSKDPSSTTDEVLISQKFEG